VLLIQQAACARFGQYALVAGALLLGEMAGKFLASETMRWWRRLGWWVPAAIATRLWPVLVVNEGCIEPGWDGPGVSPTY
jgi:hypothetical protein